MIKTLLLRKERGERVGIYLHIYFFILVNEQLQNEGGGGFPSFYRNRNKKSNKRGLSR